MIAFWLAAGLGTRLRPVTEFHPKPCVPFLNVPLGLYHFRYLQHLKIDQMLVNTHHLPEQVMELYENQKFYTQKIYFSHEKEKILGSAGGLKFAGQQFQNQALSDRTILMLNADEVIFEADNEFLKKAYQKHIHENNLATLVTMKHPEAGKKFGAIWCEDDRVCLIGKNAPSDRAVPYHYIGLIFLHQDVLSLIPSHQEVNIFYDVLNHCLDRRQVKIYNIECNWYETGNLTDYLAATKELLPDLDAKILDFINRYDPSEYKKTSSGSQLISKEILARYPQLKLGGTNVISKTTDPLTLQQAGLVENKIYFKSQVLDLAT